MAWSSIVSGIAKGVDQTIGLAQSTGWLDYSSGQSKFKYQLGHNLQATKNLQQWQAKNLPSLQRQGLEAAGYNPLLAVGSASPSVGGQVSAQFPSASSSSSKGNLVDSYLDAKQRLANIEVTNASAAKIRSETGLNAWRPVHLSRAEAIGLGVNALGALGLNVHSSGSQSFTLFYNPLTGQLQNPANGRQYIPGHANSAQDVRDGEVTTQLLDWKIEKELPKPVRSRSASDFFDPGMGMSF